jgi:hypothetical protein
LDHVFRFVLVADHPVGHPVQGGTVILDQTVEVRLR